MNDKLAIAKGITKFVVSNSAGFVVANSLKALCPTENKLQQAQVFVGAFAVGSMVGVKASDWAAKTFDETLETIQQFKNRQN